MPKLTLRDLFAIVSTIAGLCCLVAGWMGSQLIVQQVDRGLVLQEILLGGIVFAGAVCLGVWFLIAGVVQFIHPGPCAT